MGDRAAEGARLRPLGVDVDPLVVAGGVGEAVDLLLGDRLPVAVADLLAGQFVEAVDGGDGGGHGCAPRLAAGRLLRAVLDSVDSVTRSVGRRPVDLRSRTLPRLKAAASRTGEAGAHEISARPAPPTLVAAGTVR